MNLARLFAALFAAAVSGWGALAQGWPSKPIALVVPFPPGPALDVVARLVGGKLGDALGQPVVVENRTGANGMIGSNAVARAAPEGYTLLMTTASTHVTAVHLMKNLAYDPLKDFSPIVAAVEPVTCLVVNGALPVNSVQELIDDAKARPGQVSYGSSSVGSMFHLMGELFNQTAGVRINHVPYRGVAPAMQDVIAGHIPMAYLSISNALAAADARSVKILAVLEPRRFPLRPDIPSMTDVVPAFRKPSSWFGFGESNWLVELRDFPASFDSYDCALGRALGLEFVVLGRPIENVPHLARRPVADVLQAGPKVWIYRLRNPMPRIKFTQRIQVADADALTGAGQLPESPSADRVLIDDDTPPMTRYLGAGTAKAGQAVMASWRADRVEIDVASETGGVLALHDVYYPGWVAEIDGKRAAILRADVLFRGLEVPSGRHHVVFRFAPLEPGNLWAALQGLIHRR